MQFSEKLFALRRKEGMSQEQLAERLDVTRQSVSKWESGTAMPELGKLISLSELFCVSVDYLVKDSMEKPEDRRASIGEDAATRLEQKVDALASRNRIYRYTSERKICGLPLVSVCFSHDRHPCRDNTAVGVLAVGNFAVGILPVGLICAGLFPIGMLAFGGVALGMVSMGVFAFGAAAVGYLAVGASAMGVYAVGAAAQGSRVAIGAAAKAAAAVGLNAEGARVLLTDAATTAAQVLDFLKPELAAMPAPMRGVVTFFTHWVL